MYAVQRGNIELEVVFVVPNEDSDDDNPEFEDETGFRWDTALFIVEFRDNVLIGTVKISTL